MAAARLRSEAMSKVDAAWLHMDSPTNMMMITGVMMFDQPIDFQRLKATYEHRFVERYPRFRQRVREGGLLTGPRWEEDRHFNLASHVHRIALPAPGDQTALQDLVGDLMSTPLDYNKPPWQVHLIDNFGSGCAVVTRLAHCIADGIALMHVLLDLADDGPDAPWPEAAPDFEYKPPIWTRIIVPAMSAVDSTLRMGETAIHESMETVVHPERLLNVAKAGLGAAKFGTGYTLALGKLLLLPPDRRTLFKGKLGVTKRAAWTQPLALNDVKAIGRLLCGTVNDVLLSAVAGGLRRYLQSRGENTEGLNIRAMVPVNLRPKEDFGKLGNGFGLIYLSLPVGIEDTQERLHTLKRRMDAIKNSPEALVAFDILQAIGMTPNQMEKIFTTIFALKATSVMTNVPGPRETIYIYGVPMKRFMFWVPTSADLSLGVSIFSYNGEVNIGISTDAGLAPDPQNIVAGIEAEFADMREYVRYVREDTSIEDNGLPMEGPSADDRYVRPVATAAGTTITVEPVLVEEPCECPPVGEPGISTEQPIGPRNGSLEVEPAVLAALTTCEALTKSGQRCRNRPLAGQTTCRLHAAKAAVAS